MQLAYIPAPTSDVLQLGPLTIRWYGLFAAIAGILGLWIGIRRYLEADPTRIEAANRAAIFSALVFVVGARLTHVLTELPEYIEAPARVLSIWDGGLSIFGGMAMALVGCYAYSRARDLDFIAGCDAGALGLALALSIQRWGNYFNQEIYGTPTTLPWALEVDVEYRLENLRAFETFHPVFLYESLLALGIFVSLYLLDRRHQLRKGTMFLGFLSAYGTGRFLIELIRVDTTQRIWGLSVNAVMALGAAFVGSVALAWLYGRSNPAGRAD